MSETAGCIIQVPLIHLEGLSQHCIHAASLSFVRAAGCSPLRMSTKLRPRKSSSPGFLQRPCICLQICRACLRRMACKLLPTNRCTAVLPSDAWQAGTGSSRGARGMAALSPPVLLARTCPMLLLLPSPRAPCSSPTLAVQQSC